MRGRWERSSRSTQQAAAAAPSPCCMPVAQPTNWRTALRCSAAPSLSTCSVQYECKKRLKFRLSGSARKSQKTVSTTRQSSIFWPFSFGSSRVSLSRSVDKTGRPQSRFKSLGLYVNIPRGRYQKDFLADLQASPSFSRAGNGGFVESCVEHVAAQGTAFNTYRNGISGLTMQQALTAWW